MSLNSRFKRKLKALKDKKNTIKNKVKKSVQKSREKIGNYFFTPLL